MSTQICPTCNGTGAVANPQTGTPQLCPNCEGSGTITLGAGDLPFWYALNPIGSGAGGALAANQANVVAVTQIDNDWDFLWDRIVATSTGAFSMQLLDPFTSRPLMPTGVNINSANIAGTASLPFWLSRPYLIRKTSTVKGIFNDLSGAANTIQFALVGIKID